MVSFSVLQMTREAANEAFAWANYPQLIVRRQERNYVLCGVCAKLLFTCVTKFWNRQRFQNWCDSKVELGCSLKSSQDFIPIHLQHSHLKDSFIHN